MTAPTAVEYGPTVLRVRHDQWMRKARPHVQPRHCLRKPSVASSNLAWLLHAGDTEQHDMINTAVLRALDCCGRMDGTPGTCRRRCTKCAPTSNQRSTVLLDGIFGKHH